MEGFSIVDIYDTKGMEYIFVIIYLLLLIVFWNVAKNPQKTFRQIRKAVSTLSSKILRIPQGIYFNRNHTWTHLGESGAAKVGLDDFLQHVIGNIELTNLKNPGESINKGELLTEIKQDGKLLKVFSPISGEVLETNSWLNKNPGIINSDPYDQGWIYQVKPSDWEKETHSYYLADKATEWSKREIVRFKDFLSGGAMRNYSSAPSMVLLQDGGEIQENVLSELPGEVWEDFQEEFLN
ncbi:MAG: glycine cleavage system protein H [Bacteroidetes bacterium]|nr:glycine cleavage system protein H [Bacteroidota bacterium]